MSTNLRARVSRAVIVVRCAVHGKAALQRGVCRIRDWEGEINVYTNCTHIRMRVLMGLPRHRRKMRRYGEVPIMLRRLYSICSPHDGSSRFKQIRSCLSEAAGLSCRPVLRRPGT